MATIDSLPPESLHRILELIAEPDPNDYSQVASRKALAAALLVAQKWREPAQALMWLKLDFYNWKATLPILASPACGKFRTAKVTMDPSDFEDGVTVGVVLGKLKGVEEFRVWSYEGDGIDASWINFESLGDLKTLCIAALFLEDTIPTDLHPAFHLHTLELAHINSAALIHSLFATSASTLISLSIDLHYTIPALLSGLLTSLPLVANQLESITLKDFTLVPGLAAVLATFTALTSLSLHLNNTTCLLETDEFLSHFHPPFKGLSFSLNSWITRGGDHSVFDDDFGDTVLKRVGRSKAWEGLEAVEARDTQEELEGDVRGKEFLRRCAEMGIRVTPRVPVTRSWEEADAGLEEDDVN